MARRRWTFTTVAAPTPPPPSCPCSIWARASCVPVASETLRGRPSAPIPIGRISRYITGARFYKAALNTVPHARRSGRHRARWPRRRHGRSGVRRRKCCSRSRSRSPRTTTIPCVRAPDGHYSGRPLFLATGVDNPPRTLEGRRRRRTALRYGSRMCFRIDVPREGTSSTSCSPDIARRPAPRCHREPVDGLGDPAPASVLVTFTDRSMMRRSRRSLFLRTPSKRRPSTSLTRHHIPLPSLRRRRSLLHVYPGVLNAARTLKATPGRGLHWAFTRPATTDTIAPRSPPGPATPPPRRSGP